MSFVWFLYFWRLVKQKLEKAHGHDHGGAAFQKMQYVLRDVYVARVVMFLQRRATGSLVCCSNMFKMSFLILKVWVTFCKPPFLVSYFRFGHHQPPYPQQAGIGISNKRKVPGRCWWELGTFKGWRITRYYKGILKRTPAVYVCLSMLAYPPGLFWLFVLCHYPSSGTGPGWILLDMLAVPHSNLFWELRNCHFWDSMSGFATGGCRW